MRAYPHPLIEACGQEERERGGGKEQRLYVWQRNDAPGSKDGNHVVGVDGTQNTSCMHTHMMCAHSQSFLHEALPHHLLSRSFRTNIFTGSS